MESFQSGLSGRLLAASITPKSRSFALVDVPDQMPAGRYGLKLDFEIVEGSYPGYGLVFGDLARGLEGTTPRAHLEGIKVLHPIRGAALNAFVRASREPNPRRYVQPAGLRALNALNFR